MLGKVGVIRIRESAQPHVVYEVAVVKKAAHLQEAYAFVTRLIRAPAQRTFVRYGFGRKPARPAGTLGRSARQASPLRFADIATITPSGSWLWVWSCANETTT